MSSAYTSTVSRCCPDLRPVVVSTRHGTHAKRRPSRPLRWYTHAWSLPNQSKNACTSDRRCEVLVDRPYRARSFTDRGRDTLERTMPHVADCEHARHRGLERQRLAHAERGGFQRRGGQRTIGQYEPSGVESHQPVEPLGRGIGTDEAEQPGAVDRPSL